MIAEWDEWTDVLMAFARHIAPDLSEEDVEMAVEEYIEANADRLIDKLAGHLKSPEDD
jgi:hypothetical protein